MSLIDKVINLVESLLEEGDTSIEIYMHEKYAVVITDGAVETRYQIYSDEVEECD